MSYGYCDCCNASVNEEELLYTKVKEVKEVKELMILKKLCRSCWVDNRDNTIGAIIPRHTYPFLNFLKLEEETENELIYYGIEWEIDRGGDDQCVIKRIRNAIGKLHCWATYDGSLKDGIEIVSHPFTLNYYTKYLKQGYDEALNLAKDFYYSADTNVTSALHYHISKSGLGKTENNQIDTTINLWVMLYRFADKFKQISRRKSLHKLETYSKFPSFMDIHNTRKACNFNEEYLLANIEKFATDISQDLTNFYKDAYMYSRYKALNLTKEKTIELRFFNSTLRKGIFHGNFYLVDSMIKTAKTLTLSNMLSITWEELRLILIGKSRDIQKLFNYRSV